MAQFQLSEKEFVRASLTISFRRWVRSLVLFAIAFGLIVASLLFRGKPPLEAIAFPLMGIVLVIVSLRLLSTWRLRKCFREQKSLQQVIDVTIDPQHLSYSSARGSYLLPWADVRRSLETKEFFVFFESSYLGRILPKRVLSQEETAIIRKQIASKPRR